VSFFSPTIVIFFLALLACAPAWAAEAPKTKGPDRLVHCWRIEQENIYFGQCTIYACSEALKVTFINGKWMNICRAPAWELYVLNPGQKVYFHTPLDKWKANKFQLNVLNATGSELVPTHEIGKIAGQFVLQTISKVRGKQETLAKYWTARDLHFPDPIYHVLCGNDMAPQLHALPLKVVMNSSMLQNVVDTKSCVKVDLPLSFFDMPPGYRITANPEDVMNTGVMDIVKDMTAE
jgi:hypothetical protein